MQDMFKKWKKQILRLMRYRYEEAVVQNQEILEADMERIKGLEDINPLHHSKHSSKF